MEPTKLNINVTNGNEEASYEADRAVMILLNWDENGEVQTQLVANTDTPSVYALCVNACAAKLENSESEVAQMMGSVVRQGMDQVHKVAQAAAEEAAKKSGISEEEFRKQFRDSIKDQGGPDVD